MVAAVRLAGLTGASAVGAAAYGAHGFKDVDPGLKTAFDNGNRMHLAHAPMLALCPRLPRPMLSASLFLTGTVIFSGSCYAAALSGDRANGRFAPVGGTTLILAWLSLVV